MIKIEYYCDRCNKKVSNKDKLQSVDVQFEIGSGLQHRNIYFSCYIKYINEFVKLSKKLFK